MEGRKKAWNDGGRWTEHFDAMEVTFNVWKGVASYVLIVCMRINESYELDVVEMKCLEYVRSVQNRKMKEWGSDAQILCVWELEQKMNDR